MERSSLAHLIAALMMGAAVVLVVIGLVRLDGSGLWDPGDAELQPLPMPEFQFVRDSTVCDVDAGTTSDTAVSAQFESASSTVCVDEADSLADAHDADAE